MIGVQFLIDCVNHTAPQRVLMKIRLPWSDTAARHFSPPMPFPFTAVAHTPGEGLARRETL